MPHFDERGIVWPTDEIAPFTVAVVPMNMHKSESVQEYAEELYRTLQAQGVEVIFDDRKERPGVMFADMELIGVPHMVVIGEKNLANGEIEYKNRRTGEKQMIAKDQLLDFLKGQIKMLSNRCDAFDIAHGLAITLPRTDNKRLVRRRMVANEKCQFIKALLSSMTTLRRWLCSSRTSLVWHFSRRKTTTSYWVRP